jgi:hypothetical protein
MEETGSCGKLVTAYQITRRHIAESSNPYSYELRNSNIQKKLKFFGIPLITFFDNLEKFILSVRRSLRASSEQRSSL